MEDLKELKDEKIVEMAKKGNQTAFSEIFRRYKGMVKVRANSYYLAGGDNDDIIQEGMIGLFNAVRDYNEDKGFSFGTFAGVCIERQIATAIRKAASLKNSPLNSYIPISEDDECDSVNNSRDPESIIIDKENAEGKEFMLRENLSSFESLVFDMMLDEKKYAEIAEIIGVSRKSVDNAIQRIKRKMKMIKDEENNS